MCAVRCAVGYAVRYAINAQPTAQPFDKMCIYCITLRTTQWPEKVRASTKFGLHQAFRSGHSTPFTRTRGSSASDARIGRGTMHPRPPKNFRLRAFTNYFMHTHTCKRAHAHEKQKHPRNCGCFCRSGGVRIYAFAVSISGVLAFLVSFFPALAVSGVLAVSVYLCTYFASLVTFSIAAFARV